MLPQVAVSRAGLPCNVVVGECPALPNWGTNLYIPPCVGRSSASPRHSQGVPREAMQPRTTLNAGGASLYHATLQDYPSEGDTQTDDFKHALLLPSLLKRPLNENPHCERFGCAARPSGVTASFHTVRPLNSAAL